ncbi:MAG: GNAT family N-acetyltransferase [Puniceicoccales bacterium]|jgi:RimJ/RimL family protein N-acetyltransferase|nr:GNAT family N-acetyltransferase [Puniceicoccales bacterium]
MNKKSRRYYWIGVTAFLIALAGFAIGKRTVGNKFFPIHCVPRSDRAISAEKSFGPEKYVLNPGSEVLRVLEEKAKHPVLESDPNFKGLGIAPVLGTERLVLRAIHSKDWDDLTEVFSDYETVYMLAFMPWPFDRDRVKIYMMNLNYAMEMGHSLYWAITLPGEDRFIGGIGLTLEHAHDRAEMHFWLAKKYWNKGYMTEVARRVVDYIFRDLGLNRLDINHLNVNIGSQRVIEKCGFKLECEKDDFCKKEGKYENMKFYRLLRREYLASQE